MTRTVLWCGVLGMAAGLVLAAEGGEVVLEGCIRAALAGNPDLEAVAARAEAARAAVGEARSAYAPQLSLGANWTRTDNPPQAFFMRLNQRTASLQEDFNQPDDTENIRGSVGAQWRLLDGGRRAAGLRAAQCSSEASGFLVDAARNDLVYQVTRAYYGVLQASALLEVRRAAVASIEESLRAARERLQAGSALRTDVMNLEVQLSQAQEELIRTVNGRKLAVAVLNTVAGREVWKESDMAPLAFPAPALQAPAALERSVEGRPELAAARLQEKAAEAVVQKARREYYPVVNLFGSADWDGEALDDFEQSYLVGASAELTLFDGSRTRSALSGARAMLRAARAMRERVRNELNLDLRQALLREEESRERLGVAEKSVHSAGESLRITKERYEQGAADITELMTAQAGDTATRASRVVAYYDCFVAQADVDRACGRLGVEWRARGADVTEQEVAQAKEERK